MKTTIIAIAVAAVLASSSAWTQDGFPTINQDPNEYCIGHGGVVCVDWIQRDYDMPELYWAEASPEIQRKCAAQTRGGLAASNPMNFYGLLHGCLQAWVEIEYS